LPLLSVLERKRPTLLVYIGDALSGGCW